MNVILMFLGNLWAKRFCVLILVWGCQLSVKAQLPEYVDLMKPRILNNCITAWGYDYKWRPLPNEEFKPRGSVWNAQTKEVIIAVNSRPSLTMHSIYYELYSPGPPATYIHSKTDGRLLATLQGLGFSYNINASMIWRYSNNTFEAYSETGSSIVNLNFTGAKLFVWKNEVRYSRDNNVYKYEFGNPVEQLIGSFTGEFKNWNPDGEHFLTMIGTLVKVYDKNSTFIKILDLPSGRTMGGIGDFIWQYSPNSSVLDSLYIYKISDESKYSYEIQTWNGVFVGKKNITIFNADSTFSWIELSGTEPKRFEYGRIADYSGEFEDDHLGNWISKNRSGAITYGTLDGEAKIIHYGVIGMLGTATGELIVATGSKQLVAYKLEGSTMIAKDTVLVGDPKYPLPNGFSTYTLISATEAYQKQGRGGEVIDIRNGAVLFSFDLNSMWVDYPGVVAVPVGLDHLAYIEKNQIKLVNWRIGMLWYKDADQDGFGDPSISINAVVKPSGFVSNKDDCNDSQYRINPNAMWFRDEDGDGFGVYGDHLVQCTKPEGFVQYNGGWDCDDTDKYLTPLNSCIVGAEYDFDSSFPIFPNPTHGLFSVKHNNENIQFNVMSSFGEPVKTSITRNEEFYSIDISDKSSGVYLVGMSVGEKTIVTRVAKF